MKKIVVTGFGIMMGLAMCLGYAWGLDPCPGSGSDTTCYGSSVGNNASIGSYNTFIGYDTGAFNTSGATNTFLGAFAGTGNITGASNIFIGGSAGRYNSSGATGGNNNVALGFSAGQNNTSGNNNTLIGTQAGYQNIGSGNVFLGYLAGAGETSASNLLYIDNCYSGGFCDSPFIKGDFSARTLTITGTLTLASLGSISDERYKVNIQPLQQSLDKVTQLAGVSYEWKTKEYSSMGFREGRQIGLIAQDVEKVFPELVLTDGKGYKAVVYDKVVPILIEAVKEQQKEIKEKDARIERLERALDKIERRMIVIEHSVKVVALK